MVRAGVWAFVACVCVAALPSAAYGQSSIVGLVKDASGAVLPGVTVEASSNVLIEKSKSAVTDSGGRYTIGDLRPGTYVITFALAGFATVKRDAVQLPSEFTMTLNADMKVGGIEESITVTGESPVVDVTNAAHTRVLDREAIDAIPTGRSIQGMAQLIPGISLNLPDTGGARAMQQTYMSTRGLSASNNTVLVDGMLVNGLQTDGAVQSYFNDAMNAEASYQTSGINADTSAGGVRLNLIPREGGNKFSGDFKAAYRPGDWQASNLTDRLKAAGLTSGNAIDRIVDYTFAQGGPLLKDKLWFFGTARYFSVNNFIANTVMDDGSQGLDDQYIRDALVRLTWQITPSNKLSAYFDEIDKYRGHDMQSNDDPETAALRWFSPAYHTAAIKWTAPVTNKLLFEAGWSSNLEYYTNSYQEGVEKPRFSSDWFASASRTDLGLGGRKTAGQFQTTQNPERQNLQASTAYGTGGHNVKVGIQYTWGDYWHTGDYNGDLIQQYRGCDPALTPAACAVSIPRFSRPESVLVRNTPLKYGERLNGDMGIYAQDSWRLSRLTINAGLRWEHIRAQVLASESPLGRFVPARSFGEISDLPNWKGFAPRFSAVYDLFGNGKTALKYSLNRYNVVRTTGIAANYNPFRSVGTTLPWTDLNSDDIAQGGRTFNADGTYADCVYLTAGCEIDMRNLVPNFGIQSLNEFGDYPRPWNLEHSLEVQHELLPRLSASFNWGRGNFHDLTQTVDRSWTTADYTPYTFYHPLTGQPIQVFARSIQNRPTRNLDTVAPQRRQQYESFGADMRWRMPRAGQLLAGGGISREQFKSCGAPDDPNNPNYAFDGIDLLPLTTNYTVNLDACDEFALDIPWRKFFKLSGTMPIGWGVDASIAFQSNPGPTSSRQMAVTRNSTRYPDNCPAPCPAGAIIMPSSVFGQSSMTINLEPPRGTFIERINQLDLKVSRTFRLGNISVLPSFEVFNLNNSDAIISYSTGGTNVLSSNYLRPNSIMQGRMYGLGATVRW